MRSAICKGGGGSFTSASAVRKRRAPSSARGLDWLECPDAPCARALGARLDLERDLLATLKGVEVTLGAAPVEEEFLSVLGRDESKTAIRNELLDGARGHLRSPCFSNERPNQAGLGSRNRSLRSARP